MRYDRNMANQPFTPELAEWVFSQAWFPQEQELALTELFSPEQRPENDFTDHETLEIFLNQWIIYDRPTSIHRRTPLELFINAKVKHKPVERSVYEGFKRSWLGAFGIEAIQPLRSLTLVDLATGQVFDVQEERGTIGSKVGDVILARILPYGNEFLLGAAYAHIQGSHARSMRYTWDRLRDRKPVKPLTALELAPFLLRPTPTVEKWQLVVELDDFLTAKKYAARSAADIVREFERRDDPNGLVSEVLNEVPLKTTAEINTLSQLLMDLWNALRAIPPSPGQPGAGPIESSIVHDMLSQMARQQPTGDIQTAAEAKDLGKTWYQRFLHIPQPELEGRTPWQAILAERNERGNPDTDFNYEFSAIPVPNPEIDKFQQLFDDAIATFKKKEFALALNKYKKLLAFGGDHVPEVWRIYGNMGACACELGKYSLAQRYLKKALSINPDYEFGKRNFQRLTNLLTDMKRGRRMKKALNAMANLRLVRPNKTKSKHIHRQTP